MSVGHSSQIVFPDFAIPKIGWWQLNQKGKASPPVEPAKFCVALVGHSQVPQNLEVAPDVRLRVYRSPGARAASFLENQELHRVLRHQFNLAILWLGSNDVREYSIP
ncbi:hypothetical protein E2C01_055693 [Portunus trituberculatus]|uniref:SGNH hydrolase-type esterase domain-containing protein n=1 Tax=Portunus trituberculatus TaxID=210409 RepID=A0A5B7GVQ3_PORTR|nr:hypothetical protein [Portunus trituberculatus]